MKRTFKGIILVALVSALTVTGVSAFAFTDMKDTEASVLMEKIGVISGYEDGGFHPGADVTRAEAAAIIVRALGWSDEDAADFKKAAEKSSNDFSKPVSRFADYKPDYWANGYLQIAIENNVLSGFDDNTLRPEDNVTVEQLFTMLVNSIGYDTFAKASGGYPKGYLTWAYSLGINEGINATFDSHAEREHVLTGIFNTMKAPVCVIKAYETTWDGRIVPELEIKDGEGRDWQTLLARMYDIYEAEATVESVKNDTVSIKITNSMNFADEYVPEGKTLRANIKLDGNTLEKGKDYKMYIQVVDFDENEYKLVCAFSAE